MTGDIIKRESEDNVSYNVRETPCKCRFTNLVEPNAPVHAFKDKLGYQILHAHIRASEIQAECMPLDANPREPTRGDVVKKMVETLQTDPRKFHHWNNGITVICNSLEVSNASIEVDFLAGEGICNGGHTYFSIVTFPSVLPEDCIVHVEFVVLPQTLSQEERNSVINDIAARRNRNRALMPTTQADFLGFYADFQSVLGDDSILVSWHEGDSDASPGAVKSELLIRMLACLDPFWFQHPTHSNNPNHKKAATSSAAIHSSWFDAIQSNDPEGNLLHMAPLLPECFELHERICHSLMSDDLQAVSKRFRGTAFYNTWIGKDERDLKLSMAGKVGVKLPSPALIMMLGAFRSNVWLGLNVEGYPLLTGWLVEPWDLWEQTKCDYLKALLNDFGDADNDPGSFIKNSSPYQHQLLGIQYGRQAPTLPLRFYDMQTKCWWDASPEGELGLECDADGYCTLILAKAEVASLNPEQRYSAR